MAIPLELAARGSKTGRVCSRDYRRGPACPLILRTTSEDVMTATVFGILRRIRPSLWLRPLLDETFRTRRFTTVPMRDLGVSFWQPVTVPSLRAGVEGNTEVDVLIRYGTETVFIECKYLSPLSTRTKHDPSRDQLARLLDAAYSASVAGRLFQQIPWVVVLGLQPSEPELVTRYRDPESLAAALGHYRQFPEHAPMARFLAPRVGYASWVDLQRILTDSAKRGSRTERGFLEDVVAYLDHRISRGMGDAAIRRQMLLPVVGEVPEGPEDESNQ